MKRILVLAGGGIRGAMQLDTLLFLERYYGRPISKIYDLIVGTSVGAITGGILATGMINMQDYREIFVKNVPNVFQKPWWRLGLFRPLYKRENMKLLWKTFFGDQDLRMNHLQTKFVCTAVNVCDDETHVFRSWNLDLQNESLFETIAKSFAAPYYFGPFRDEKKKIVWTDGGVGVSNAPLDWAFTETIELGWQYEPREFILLGTGGFHRAVTFNHIKSNTDMRKIFRYLDPLKGGFARVQSELNQIRRMRVIANADPDIDFHVYQLQIPHKYEPIDKVKFLNQYLYYGKILASQVASYLDSLDTTPPNISTYQESEIPKESNEKKVSSPSNQTEIILYLDLFSGALKKSLLIRAIIEYYHQIKHRYPHIDLLLFFYTKENDPFLSPKVKSSADLVQMVERYYNIRDSTFSNLENGVIFCLSYFATLTLAPSKLFRLIILSDLASLWGENISEVIIALTNKLQHIDYSIDVIRFGNRDFFPDNQKLETFTKLTGGKLEYKRSLVELLHPNPFAFLLDMIQ